MCWKPWNLNIITLSVFFFFFFTILGFKGTKPLGGVKGWDVWSCRILRLKMCWKPYNLNLTLFFVSFVFFPHLSFQLFFSFLSFFLPLFSKEAKVFHFRHDVAQFWIIFPICAISDNLPILRNLTGISLNWICHDLKKLTFKYYFFLMAWQNTNTVFIIAVYDHLFIPALIM